MRQAAEPASSGLAAVLRGVVADLQRASDADMVSLVLYDQERHGYYAPFSAGLPEDGLRESVADMRAQLDRYLGDREQGKVPDELRVQHYGSTVWLTVTRQMLVARHAPSEIDSTFIRRYQVESTVGLPLLQGDRLLGLVYLNYRGQGAAEAAQATGRLDDKALGELQSLARAAAGRVAAALDAAERSALEGLGRLAALLTQSPAEPGNRPTELGRVLSITLADMLLASKMDAAAIYEFGPNRSHLHLLTANAPAAAPDHIRRPQANASWESVVSDAIQTAMAPSNVFPVATYPLGSAQEPCGYLVIMSRDRLAGLRSAPATEVLLRGAADLLAGALLNRRLITDLENSNRLLGALDVMASSMLRPGSSRREVLEAVVRHLTDAAVPEFDFHFATVYLLEETSDQAMVVRMATGASTVEAIDARQGRNGGSGAGRTRVPRWALEQDRALSPQDVLVYVAGSWQAAIVGPAGSGPDSVSGDGVVAGMPPHLKWIQAPARRNDGTTVATVPVALIGEPRSLEGRPGPADGQPPFTLAADIFESSGHADLIRIFLPFGFDARSRASGVLEVGYHRSLERRPDWGQIEALRAAATQVAVAVETARLYEETRRHAEEVELSADVSKAIASSIDLEQTLRLVARNLVRLVNASVCQIALFEEDGQGWYGAAASDDEELWRRQHGEGAGPSFLFEARDRAQPVVVEDAGSSSLVGRGYVEAFGVRSLLAIPLLADGHPIGVAILAERHQTRRFTAHEVQRAEGLVHQAAVAIKNARLHSRAEEETHIQKDFILIGFGQWGQKAYQHLQILKQFFNFRIHVVEQDNPAARERLAGHEEEMNARGDTLYWDSPGSTARDQLERELESSCYVITYIASPAATHLANLARFYDISDVVLIEKPLGAPPEKYREFLDAAPGDVEIVAADHYYFKLEVRLLQMLLTEERTLRTFLDSVEEIRVEILEAQALTGAAADIGVVADLIPHALAIVSMFTPVDRIQLDPGAPLLVGRHDGLQGQRESYARMQGTFLHRGRSVRLVIDVGKGVEDAKWIKLSAEQIRTGRSPFYKFDFGRGEAIDGTQSTVRAAVRRIREPGVTDNAHLTMLRHIIEKRRPAVGILSIREAIRANQRIQDLEAMAGQLLAKGSWTEYPLGTRPAFASTTPYIDLPTGSEAAAATAQERARARG